MVSGMRLVTAGAAALLAMPAAMAHAAEMPMAAGASAVEEVVVTARKREERLQDIPVAVTAVTAETIERQQLLAVKDVAAFAPGLNINADSVGRAFVSIRGVGTTVIDTVQPGVGIFIDGVNQPNTSYLNSPLLDVERIEVLRGPQGALFGNNTLGGAINVVTRQPSDVWRGAFTGAYAGPDNYQTISGSVSGPIVRDRLQFRLGGSYHDQQGFEKSPALGGAPNPLTQTDISGALRFAPANSVVLTLDGYYEKVAGGWTPYAVVSGPTGYTEDVQHNQDSTATYEYSGVHGKLEAETAKTRITAVGAYDHRKGEGSRDGDFGPLAILSADARSRLSTFTGELRFDSRWNDRLSTLVGLFADQSTTDADTLNTNIPLGLSVPAFDRTQLKAQAIYGNVFYRIDPTLELAAGLRWDRQTIDQLSKTDVYRASELEPRFTLTKHWTPQAMTYGSLARGFRGGGSNGPGAPNPLYRGDSVWTYEVGTKLQGAARDWTLNLAAFYNDYSHFIGQNVVAPSTTGVGFVLINLNTGKVESYGLEAEGAWRATGRLTLSGGLTLLHARITDGSEFEAASGLPLPTDRIVATPDWNGYLNAAYLMPAANGDRLRFDLTLIAKGERVVSTLDPASAPMLDSYALVNASVAWIHDGVELSLFATNLFDAKYFDSYIDSSVQTQAGLRFAHNLGIMGDRRRYGVRTRYAF